jgi:four helix bundle protein
MATFQSFEEIESWKQARELTKRIYQVTGEGGFARDFGLRDQIRRASVSILSNIAEGFERDGTKEFIQFLSMAKGSAGEVKAQLYIALDLSYISQPDFNALFKLADEIGKLIGGMMKYLKASEIAGKKYH